MNKKYITKYLPLEEEIKVDSMISVKGLNYLTQVKRIEGDKVYNYNEEEFHRIIDGIKPYKLFLCSRDIQVGDMIAHPIHGERIYDINAERQFGVQTHLDKNWVKKIGEISPDALSYVKEGDEFDDKDVRRDFIDDTSIIIDREWDSGAAIYADKTIYKVKGPCGRFH